jgi:hypothetical protein
MNVENQSNLKKAFEGQRFANNYFQDLSMNITSAKRLFQQ